MKLATQAMFLALTLFLGGAACGRKVRLPQPPSDSGPADARETAKIKNQYIKIITRYGADLNKLNQELDFKRTAGYNTSEAEALLKETKEEVDRAKDLLFWDKFEELNQTLDNLDKLVARARERIRHAPKFGDRPIKKEKIARKYFDDRDRVKELRGREPDPQHKSSRYPITVRLSILDATATLQYSRCWDPGANQFVLENPPAMESWYYPEDKTMYIFAEDNVVFQQFMLRNDLPPQQRDALLAELCEKQANFGGLTLIYVGPPVADLSSIMEQVLTGRMRFAGMFGLEGMERKMRATAALPDLTIAALAFNTEFYLLNLRQKKLFDEFYGLMQAISPDTAAFFFSVEQKEEFLKFYEAALAKDELGAGARKILENFKQIILGVAPDEVKKRQVKDLLEVQNKEFKRRFEAIATFFRWQQTLNPSDNDIERLVKFFPAQEAAIRAIGEDFHTVLLKLSDQFEVVRKQLLRFVINYPEQLFRQDEFIAIFCLIEGVRFEEKILPNNATIDVPDLSVKVIVRQRLDKYEDPVAEVETPEIKITAANRYIEVTKEYRRLTSFGLIFPFQLPPGRYEVTIMVTDNLRIKSTQQEVVWTIVAVEAEGLLP